MSTNPELIIFDCDGVLVDTEHITGAYFQRYLVEHGIEDPHGEALYRYRGFSLAGAIADLEKRTGKPVPDDFIDSFRADTMATMAADLRAIDGVADALDAILTNKCVASNGPLQKMELTLGVTGLRPHFGDALFSAYCIQKWKPEPDLFLHAADAMKVPPDRCIVIEDSVHGIAAAVSAGMRVFGYAPHGNVDAFREAGAHSFSDMAQLPGLLASA